MNIKQYVTPKLALGFSILVLLVLAYFLVPWISSHIHLSNLQDQLSQLNHQILSNSQQWQELDQKIHDLRTKQSELSTSSQTLRRQRDQLEQSIAEQMGL
jgi:septal ring factor EnvC (AmiA/AmiB activator)